MGAVSGAEHCPGLELPLIHESTLLFNKEHMYWEEKGNKRHNLLSFLQGTINIYEAHVFPLFSSPRALQIVARGREVGGGGKFPTVGRGGIRNYTGAIFLWGGGNLRRSDFYDSNLFQS